MDSDFNTTKYFLVSVPINEDICSIASVDIDQIDIYGGVGYEKGIHFEGRMYKPPKKIRNTVLCKEFINLIIKE